MTTDTEESAAAARFPDTHQLTVSLADGSANHTVAIEYAPNDRLLGRDQLRDIVDAAVTGASAQFVTLGALYDDLVDWLYPNGVEPSLLVRYTVDETGVESTMTRGAFY